MASQIQASRFFSPSWLSILEFEKETRPLMLNLFPRRNHLHHSTRRASWTINPMKRADRRIAFALDTGSSVPGDNDDRSVLGSTRLGRIAIAGGKQLLLKLNSARKNFPMKIFLLLLGFYTANALATILGQTGDWDVLVAGIVVAAIEGIGMLMYKKPSSSMLSGKLQSFVVFMNFWKAGVCLGLFVDAFKLGS